MVAAIGAAAVVGSAMIQSNAADKAGDAQHAAGERAGALLAPWADMGVRASTAQGELVGLSGPEAQQAAIDRLKGGAEFGSLKKAGEDAILQNASATGGLRGGNVNAALSQYDQSLLTKLINEQYTRLGGISAQGINAVNGQAASATQVGAADAGAILGEAKALTGGINGLTNAAGVYMGSRPPPATTVATTPSGVPMQGGGFGEGPAFA